MQYTQHKTVLFSYYFPSPLGINSPQALKKILSLSEEGSLERHKKQAEDTISNASSPPTSPQSSPRKGRTPTFSIFHDDRQYWPGLINSRTMHHFLYYIIGHLNDLIYNT